MSQPFLGEIQLFAGNFAPKGYALCAGQILAISQNTALFSLLGTNFGGNGTSNFALPDLRGRIPISQGQGPGLTPYSVGENGGAESVTLLSNQVGAHNHTFGCGSGTKGENNTVSNEVAADEVTGTLAYSTTADSTVMSAAMIAPTAGASQPHENRQPYVTVNYIIATSGIFPARN
jgi:microcystin-dependent protein